MAVIKVSATEFQQKVGLYSDLADEGEEILVQNKKEKKDYVFKKARKKRKTEKTRVEILKEHIKKYSTNEKMEDALEFQNRIRE